MKLQFRDMRIGSPDLELRVDLGAREAEGHANVFLPNGSDSYGSRFMPGAFKQSVREKGNRIRFLRGHWPEDVLGPMLDIKEDDKGLYFRAGFSETQLGNDTLTLVKDKAIDELSIGFTTIKQQQNKSDGVMEKFQVDLWEISVVTFAANNKSRIEAVRSMYDHVLDVEERAGRTMSQKNLDALHTSMGNLDSIHNGVCDMTDCTYANAGSLEELALKVIVIDGQRYVINETDPEKRLLDLGPDEIQLDPPGDHRDDKLDPDDNVDSKSSGGSQVRILRARALAIELGVH